MPGQRPRYNGLHRGRDQTYQDGNAVGSNAELAGLARRLRTWKHLCATESQVVVS